MKCPKCGKEIANDSNFCDYCGVRLNTVLAPQKQIDKGNQSILFVLCILLVVLIAVIFLGLLGCIL